MSIEVKCEKCGGRVAAEDVNLDRLVARCRSCNTLFDCSSQLPVSGAGRSLESVERGEVPCPANLVRESRGSELLLRYSWFNAGIVFLTFFCIAWDGFLIFWYGIALSQPHIPWIMVLFPICHVAVGVGLTYTVLCGYLNKTEIQVNRNQLRVRHYPLPWPGQLSLPTHDVEQLFSVEIRGNKGARSYQVCALLRGGRKVMFLRSTGSSDRALYVEQQIESFLGIKDRPVGGELPR